MTANRIVREDMDYILARVSPGDSFRDAVVLVTGCAGFLGYYFMHFFACHGEQLGVKSVVGLDNFMLGRRAWLDRLVEEHPGRLRLSTFDVIRDDIAAAPDAAHASHVVHMASIASPTFYRKYPIETLDANIRGLRRLLDFYRDKKLRGMLVFSSSEVYGDPFAEFIPTGEEYRGNVPTMGPRACYDEAKRFSETLCYLFHQQHQMPIAIARPFNNYGPGLALDDGRAPADFAKAVFDGEDIEIFSDGSPTRTFCYISDAVTGYLKMLIHGSFDYFNIGIDRPEISIRRLAEIYVEAGREVFGYSGTSRCVAAPEEHYLTHNPSRRCPRIDKARRILAYEPSILVEQGVRRFLEFIEMNQGEL
jgi:UDP-glucuronate decarboxylase